MYITLLIVALVVGPLIALRIYRRTSGTLLNSIGGMGLRNTAVILTQLVYLVLLIVGLTFCLWWVFPITDSPSPESIRVAFTMTPMATTRKYYAELNNGVTSSYFWDAYDLWSECQKQSRTYDDLKEVHEHTKRIELIQVEPITQTEDSASVLATVKLVRVQNRKLLETTHRVHYDLVKENDNWRMDYYQSSQETSRVCPCLRDDSQICR